MEQKLYAVLSEVVACFFRAYGTITARVSGVGTLSRGSVTDTNTVPAMVLPATII
jgi:hypothetical protein